MKVTTSRVLLWFNPSWTLSPLLMPQFMYRAGQWVFLSLFILSCVSQTAPIPALLPAGPAVPCSPPADPGSAWHRLQFSAEPAPAQSQQKAAFVHPAGRTAVCVPAWFVPFSAVWHFCLFFCLVVTPDPRPCSYFTSCCHFVLIFLTIPAYLCFILSLSSGVNLLALDRIMGLNLISFVFVLSLRLFMKILSSTRIKRHHVNPPRDLPC